MIHNKCKDVQADKYLGQLLMFALLLKYLHVSNLQQLSCMEQNVLPFIPEMLDNFAACKEK